MNGKLEFIGVFSFKLIFEKDGYFYRFQFLFYVPFRIAGKEPKGRPKEKGGCDSVPFLWNPIPIALFVLTQLSSLPALSAFRTLRSAWIFRPLFLQTQQTFRAFSSVILKFKTKNALAGAFSAVTCSQNSLVLFERIFRDWSHLFFLLSLVRFLSSFSEKRRKK